MIAESLSLELYETAQLSIRQISLDRVLGSSVQLILLLELKVFNPGEHLHPASLALVFSLVVERILEKLFLK